MLGPSSNLPVAPRTEQRRLDRHFRRVLTRLHRAPPAGLGPAQRRARARHLEALDGYRRGRVFPKNTRHFGQLLPIFIDPFGTRCAMAHLVERAGGAELVQHVARARNYDFVHQLADIPELVAWLEANGLTQEEAAAIQPTYCQAAADCFCESITAILEGDAIANNSFVVTEVHGADVAINVGETVGLLSAQLSAVAGDHVFAKYSISSEGYGWLKGVLTPAGDVRGHGCPPGAFAPSTLPTHVFLDAMLAGNAESCESVLGAYDPAWLQVQGDCNSPTSAATGSGGGSSGGGGGGGEGATAPEPTVVSDCSFHPPANAPSLMLVVVAGTLALLRLRRAS